MSAGVVRLGEVDEAAVVGEDIAHELRVPIEPERPDHERIEMSHEEVGEVEGSRFLVVHRLPRVVPGEEAVAVRAGEPLGAVALSTRSSAPTVPQSP